MTITKFGHSCLLIEQNGTRILTDPGVWTSQQNDLTDVDIIIITHQHPDHFSINSVKALIANNPRAQIITNSSVGELLKTEGIAFQILENT
ncbi:MAG: MBL fold metallo-hydrolase, partial [Patescibacteria group bacterium]